MQNIINKLHLLGYVVPFLAILLLVLLWNSTNPATIGPLGILSVFVLLYLFWMSIFFIFLHLLFKLIEKVEWVQAVLGGKRTPKFRHQKGYYIASILAFIPVLLLAMQSVSQLTLRDFGLVTLFVGLAIFYVLKRV